MLLPAWLRRYIAKKYGLDTPGKFVVDRYMHGSASSTLMPESPMYVSTANGKVLLEALRYAEGHPGRLNHVFDFAVRFAKNGVFCDNRAADEFLSQVVASKANQGEQLTVDQLVWTEMTEDQRRNVTIPGELIDEYLINKSVWFVLSRAVVFGSIFAGVLWIL